jgi:hypothetical protein
MFGERLEPNQSAAALRRAFYSQVVKAETGYAEAKKMLLEHDPFQFVRYYPAIRQYLDREKPVRPTGVSSHDFDLEEWVVPDAVWQWKKANIDNPTAGRKSSLVLVGPTRTGKTVLALSLGPNPISMDGCWNMDNYYPDASHVVVNDVDARKFGPSGFSFWKQVLGCQQWVDVFDRYTKTKRLKWGFPCVWTCNAEDDPRQYSEVRDYLQSNAVVVDVTNRLYGRCDDTLQTKCFSGEERGVEESPIRVTMKGGATPRGIVKRRRSRPKVNRCPKSQRKSLLKLASS